ncbi:hypothetical protein CEXT_132421 [Caerostris extrusa]|uniref:Uncharacterized protein n=1 Tax=Caerostris extrusa TaxID=172846 RepID=A0AAV4UAA7_CAEEX|nr:hypothetical protein CEXT_132421 [Caerostris extrusa]
MFTCGGIQLIKKERKRERRRDLFDIIMNGAIWSRLFFSNEQVHRSPLPSPQWPIANARFDITLILSYGMKKKSSMPKYLFNVVVSGSEVFFGEQSIIEFATGSCS